MNVVVFIIMAIQETLIAGFTSSDEIDTISEHYVFLRVRFILIFIFFYDRVVILIELVIDFGIDYFISIEVDSEIKVSLQ